MTDPIRIPVKHVIDFGNGDEEHDNGHAIVTPELARQIVALSGLSGEQSAWNTKLINAVEALERGENTMQNVVDEMGRRIDALEASNAWLMQHAVVGGSDGKDVEPFLGAAHHSELERAHATGAADKPAPSWGGVSGGGAGAGILRNDGKPACVCGDPSTPDVVHRQDGPCYHADQTAGDDAEWACIQADSEKARDNAKAILGGHKASLDRIAELEVRVESMTRERDEERGNVKAWMAARETVIAERDQAIGIANSTAKERDIWKADATSWEKAWHKLSEAAKAVLAVRPGQHMGEAIDQLSKALQ